MAHDQIDQTEADLALPSTSTGAQIVGGTTAISESAGAMIICVRRACVYDSHRECVDGVEVRMEEWERNPLVHAHP